MKAELKKHTEIIEKKVEQAMTKIEGVCQKLNEVEKTQEDLKKKQALNKQHIDGLLKESLIKEKENEAIVKKMKKNEEELRRANQTIDDLEQYGRKTMLEISGFPRQEKESAIGLVLKLAEHLDVDLNETGIEACHRISPKADAAIIVEFSSRRKETSSSEQRRK
eukprot:gene1497-biopygen1240